MPFYKAAQEFNLRQISHINLRFFLPAFTIARLTVIVSTKQCRKHQHFQLRVAVGKGILQDYSGNPVCLYSSEIMGQRGPFRHVV